MPLKHGYSYAVFEANVANLRAEGEPRAEALARAFEHARRCYFKRYPQGALPVWLAYPRTHRMREHYGSKFEPIHIIRVRPNPAPPPEVQRAAKLYRAFTGKRPGRITRVPLTPLPKAGLAFGELFDIGYRSFRDGKLYRHSFRVSSRPLVVASSDGKQVLIVGGRYAFTDRGIEDR